MFMDFLIYFSDICSQNNNFVIEHYQFDLINGDYTSNKDYAIEKSVKKDGYTAVGVVQYVLEGNYSTWFMITRQTLNNDVYNIRIRGYSDFSTNSLLFMYVSILYKKSLNSIYSNWIC